LSSARTPGHNPVLREIGGRTCSSRTRTPSFMAGAA
jgi:hypothetical protein